jgi:hypothetical protein
VFTVSRWRLGVAGDWESLETGSRWRLGVAGDWESLETGSRWRLGVLPFSSDYHYLPFSSQPYHSPATLCTFFLQILPFMLIGSSLILAPYIHRGRDHNISQLLVDIPINSVSNTPALGSAMPLQPISWRELRLMCTATYWIRLPRL